MKVIDSIEEYYLKNFEAILYITLFSTFLAKAKIYIPLFALNILIIGTLVIFKKIKVSLSKWQIAILVFMLWALVSSIISIVVLNHGLNVTNFIKLNLNMGFLLAASIVINNKDRQFSKDKFINFLEFIIIVNFIQIILIYTFGGLWHYFFNGILTQRSDTAYVISAYYNVIGEEKNIWAGKMCLVYIIYLYISVYKEYTLWKVRKYAHIIIGAITLLLLVSRTIQLAILVPLLAVVLYSIKDFNKKYCYIIYSIFGLGAAGALIIFFKKIFSINLDMMDGGVTRIFIWKNFFTGAIDKNIILGNGIGHSAYFIQNVLGRVESNFHNVYLNLTYELGILGVASYVTFLVVFFKEQLLNNKWLLNIAIIAVPFIIITSMQYLGFDSEIVIMFIFILIANKGIINDRGFKEKKIE